MPRCAASLEVCHPDDSKVATCLAYSSEASTSFSRRNLLGIACEEGFVSIVDATRPASTLPTSLEGPQPPLAHWQAHQNLIHHLLWAKVRTRRLASIPMGACCLQMSNWAGVL